MNQAHFSWASLVSNVSSLISDDNYSLPQNPLYQTLETLKNERLDGHVVGWFFDFVQKYTNEVLSPRFWNHFEDFELKKKNSSKSQLRRWVEQRLFFAVNQLHSITTKLESFVHLLQDCLHPHRKDFLNRFWGLIQALIYTSNREFKEILYIFFDRKFQIFSKKRDRGLLGKKRRDRDSQDEEEGSEGHVEEEDDDEEEEEEEDEDLEEMSEEEELMFYEKLHQLEAIKMSEEIISEILFHNIENKILTTCRGKFDNHHLSRIINYTNTAVFSWLQIVLIPSQFQSKFTFLQWRTRLEFFVYETFAELRTSEMFDIIVEFPESTPALEDLRECLTQTQHYGFLVASLRNSFQQRLLHPGANTSVIITQYISTFKALRLLDPSSLIIDNVCQCIRDYLREREDTIRCIVSALTDDTNTELFEELNESAEREAQNTLEDELYDDTEDSIESSLPPVFPLSKDSWMPDLAKTTIPSELGKTVKKSDVLGTLVDIYGTKDVFINEYRNLLSARLLSLRDYDTQKELMTMELLKLRFGENSLNNCEIMLKDIADSKRINNHVHSTIKPEDGLPQLFNSTIISGLFWPQMKEDALSLPEPIKQLQNKYQEEYQKHKAPRKLDWKNGLGSVELSLKFSDGRSLDFTVAPILATIVLHFQAQPAWKLEELAEQMGVGEETVRKKLAFWVNQSVIRELGNNEFELIEIADGHSPEENSSAPSNEPEDFDGNEQENDAELEMCRLFIQGMLTNLGALSADRIHEMLAAVIPNYSLSLGDLTGLLEQLVRSDVLNNDAAIYSLRDVS